MVEPVLELIPSAEVWHLGLYRDEETAKPVKYYSKLPEERPVDVALILDPMLATGGSVIAALTTLRQWGVPQVKLLSLIASEEGVKLVESEFPDSQIYVCQIDPDLNDRKFIVPGSGRCRRPDLQHRAALARVPLFHVFTRRVSLSVRGFPFSQESP